MRLAVFLSGKGSNFKAILTAIHEGRLEANVVLVVSNNPEAEGLITADEAGIPSAVLDRRTFASGEAFGNEMLRALREAEVDFIALAGYMRMIPPAVTKAFPRRIVNVHPALLPKFGGKGMYGRNVHEAVIAARELESGVTVHYVDEVYDHGDIIAQRAVPVLPNDTPETLGERVLQTEHQLYPEILQQLASSLN